MPEAKQERYPKRIPTMTRIVSFSLLLALLIVLLPYRAFAACWDDLQIKPLEILTWNTAQKLCGYENMEHLWSSNVVSRSSAPAKELPRGDSFANRSGEVRAFMQTNGVNALLVIQNGAIQVEEYLGSMDAKSRWTSFSMAKSLTGLLVGAAVADGHIQSLDDPVSNYLPELKKGAYADVTVRQVLTMTSGAAWNENYRDPESDVAKLADLANGDEKSFLAYMAARKRAAKPGTRFNYSTGEAGIIGHMVRRATGKTLSAYMSEKIWAKLGMERDAIWITDKTGSEISGCCFSATLRDYGRMGLFMLQNGRIGNEAVLPKSWMKEAAKASAPSREQHRPYGYQIWVRDSGSYQASGIFGQMIHVDPSRNLVIVMLSAWENATGTGKLHKERSAFISAVRKEVDGRAVKSVKKSKR